MICSSMKVWVSLRYYPLTSLCNLNIVVFSFGNMVTHIPPFGMKYYTGRGMASAVIEEPGNTL
jgi:hypothetical protein